MTQKFLTWLEIDSQAIQYNLQQFRKLIGPNNLLMPVIKANAYGHGFLEMARICAQNKNVDRICVVNLDEALALIKNRIRKPIMILSFYDSDKNKLQGAVKNNAIFPLYDLKQAEILNHLGKKNKKEIKVHLEVDTGASRTGVMPKEILGFVKKMRSYPFLELEGIWSHFASSEEDPKYTHYQLKRFEQVIHILDKAGIKIPLKHMACSASTVLYPESRFNAIRLGLSLYGLYDAPQIKNRIALKPALSWYTTIIQVKEVPSNTKIGYGGTYITKKRTKLAIIPVGYWDGYDRKLSNQGEVIIYDQKCPIRGRICMNLSMVDITKIKGVKVGDKVILIGKDKKTQITVEDLAHQIGTINDEVVTRINPFLPRIYLK
jgi:alanine racemase